MPLLDQRFEGLGALPRIALAALPTPVERLEHTGAQLGAEVWCKRDDRTDSSYGGNKVRKLELLLGEARARGSDALVTLGAWGSHHVLATAVHGGAHRFEVHAVLVPQPLSAHVEEALRADLAAGAILHPSRTWAGAAATLAAVTARLRLSGKRPRVIGPGGTSKIGAVGYVEAGLELAGQIDAGELPEPRRIYVAGGSGGTAVGLAIGLATLGLRVEVVAVRVTQKIALAPRRMRRLCARTVAHLREADRAFPDVTTLAMQTLSYDDSELSAGYGVSTESGDEAARVALRDGLVLDSTYTAKTFAAMLRHAGAHPDGGPYLYLHTLSSADLRPLLAHAPPVPAWARA